MNTPGPLFTGQADFALMGPTLAPRFVCVDEDGIDVVYRQPMRAEEFRDIMWAATHDPFDGYSAEGNLHWNAHGIRDWWRRRGEIVAHINKNVMSREWWKSSGDLPILRSIGTDWLKFLECEAEPYLRCYMAFLQDGVWPDCSQTLPDL